MAIQLLDGSSVVVGVTLENDYEGLDDVGGTNDLDFGEYMGALYGAGPGAAQNAPIPLYTIELVTDVSFDAFEVDIEEIQTLADNYVLPREIKKGGSVSVTFETYNDTTTLQAVTTVDAFNWLYAHLNLPFGCTNTAAGTTAAHSILEEAPTGGLVDPMGYAVEIVVDSLVKFVFHNCRLEVKADVGFQKNAKLTATFSEARWVEMRNETSITTHTKV